MAPPAGSLHLVCSVHDRQGRTPQREGCLGRRRNS